MLKLNQISSKNMISKLQAKGIGDPPPYTLLILTFLFLLKRY